MDELIDALRNCSSPTVGSCTHCPYHHSVSCKWQMMEDAADAIERLVTEIDRKDKAIQGLLNTIDKLDSDQEQLYDELIQRLCQHCDTTPEEKLKEGCCENCPIIAEIKEVFDGE